MRMNQPIPAQVSIHFSARKITMMQVGEKVITGVTRTPARTFLSPQLGIAKREADMFAGVLDECYKCV